MAIRILVNVTIVLALTVGFGACGSKSPTSPGGGGGGGSDGTIAQTITITAAGVSPKDVTISAGQRVQFVNNDTQSHTINSDPHPTHGDCPGIDSVGFIAIGATKASSNLNTVRTCGYHDHVLFSDTRFQGTIRVQ
jgi:plastocyanin